MPYSRYTKTSPKRKFRSTKRKAYSWNKFGTIGKASRFPYSIAPKRDLSIVSTMNPATLVYGDRAYTTVGVAGNYEVDIGANCLYDPYLGLGGHQPRGFQELIALYRKSYVKACAAKVTFELATNDRSAVVGCWFENTGTASTYLTSADIIENAKTHGGKWAIISNVASRVGYISLDVSALMAKVCGVGIKDDTTWNSVSSNPLTQVHLKCVALNLSNNTSDIAIGYEVTYDSLFFQPITLASS